MGVSYTIRWLTPALHNFDQETLYIHRGNPKAAKKFVAQVKHQVNLLRDHPHMGRPGRLLKTRELVIQGYPYIIPYRVKENYIDTLRVFHTARKYPLM